MKERIKELRKALCLTQTEFGEKLGVSKSAVTNWEYGQNEPSNVMIGLICSKWSVNRAWLMDGIGEMMLVPETADEVIDQVLTDGTDLQKAFLRAAAKRPAAELEAMIQFLEAVQEEMKNDQ